MCHILLPQILKSNPPVIAPSKSPSQVFNNIRQQADLKTKQKNSNNQINRWNKTKINEHRIWSLRQLFWGRTQFLFQPALWTNHYSDIWEQEEKINPSYSARLTNSALLCRHTNPDSTLQMKLVYRFPFLPAAERKSYAECPSQHISADKGPGDGTLVDGACAVKRSSPSLLANPKRLRPPRAISLALWQYNGVNRFLLAT